MKKKFQKVFALLLTVSMLMSMMGVTAFAAEGTATSDSQIVKGGGTVYYNEAGTAVTATKLGENGAVVGLSKTIAGTALENEFDITLTVETSLKQEEHFSVTKTHTPDAAVVLSVDLSGTMRRDANKMDGKWYITVAKEKAAEFIASYAASAGTSTAKRMLAIVGFDTDAKLIMNWVDVNPNNNSDYATADIAPAFEKLVVADNGSTSSDQVCTNFDGGVILTKNLFKQAAVTSIPKENSWGIILSDGAPTVTVSGDSSTVGTIKSTFWTGQGYQKAKNGGGWTHPQEVSSAYTYMTALAAEANVNIIGVGGLMDFKLFNDAVYGTSNGTRTSDVKNVRTAFNNVEPMRSVCLAAGYTESTLADFAMNTTTGFWMQMLAQSVGGSYVSAASSSELASKFTDILNTIKTKTTTTTWTETSTAWNAVDPIGASSPNHVAFLGFYGAAGYVQNKTSVTNSTDGDTASVTNNTINWDLKNSTYTETAASGSTSKTYTYSIKYRVRLTNEAANFAENTAVATNGTTTFTYQTVSNNSFGTPKTVEFPVPAVEGYLVDFTFTKENADGKPLNGATFTLTHANCNCSSVTIAAKTATSDSNGTVTFENVPSGHTYTLAETSAPAGYDHDTATHTVKVAYDKVYLDGSATAYTGSLSIANKPQTVSVSGAKTWDDNNDANGDRPASITIRLLADGEEVDSKTVTASDDWKWNFTGLAKYAYKADGAVDHEIVYTITEDTVSEYTSTVNGYNVTNKYTPGKTSVDVTKVWEDSNDQDGIRPDSITVKLLADGADTGKTVTLNESNSWTATFSDLDKKVNGKTIAYTVEEVEVEGYTSVITGSAAGGYTITNTHEPETTSVEGSKTWSDGNDQDGIRPDSITINLLADSEEVDSKTVTKADGWAWSFTDLPKYANGVEIQYTITEDAVEGYASTVNGYNVTNSHTPGTTTVTVTKVWADGSDQDGIRPTEISVQLYADGEELGATVTLSETNDWTYTWSDLALKANGQTIIYSVDETAVPEGYEKNVANEGNVYTITNTHETDTTSVEVTKVWDDNNDQDGIRPSSITVKLLADTVDTGKSVTLNDTNDWKASFTDLPVKASGQDITYTVEEVEVEGYTSAVTGSAAAGFTITNTHTTSTTSISGRKDWNDNGNQDGLRPDVITVILKANGVEVGKKSINQELDNWAFKFEDLPTNKDGAAITYTVEEETVPTGYTMTPGTKENGYTITNTHTPATVTVAGSKTWDDKNDLYGKRPDSITINLLADGQKIDEKVVTEADSWAWSFADLPKYSAGTEIAYSISEDAVIGYIVKVNGYDVTNTYDIPNVPTEDDVVTVTKVWNDNGNSTARPASVTVQLKDNSGTVHGTATLSAANNWTHTWYVSAGYAWNVVELDVPTGYTSRVTSPNGLDFTVTNTYEIEIIEEDPPLIDLEDEDVPLATPPATGDASILWAALSALSGSSLFLTRKKREDEE